MRGPKEIRVVTDPDRVDLVLAEAKRGYDLVVLADVQRSGLRVASTRAFFGHRIERMLAEAPCPVAIVCAS